MNWWKLDEIHIEGPTHELSVLHTDYTLQMYVLVWIMDHALISDSLSDTKVWCGRS
jgi:hypothetical protein